MKSLSEIDREINKRLDYIEQYYNKMEESEIQAILMTIKKILKKCY